MPYSHHSHSGQFCKHASGTLEEAVLEAIRQGFEVFGLTEHVPRYRPSDLYPEEEGLTSEELVEQFHNFLLEAWHLKTKYADRIALLVGLETEHITAGDLDHLDALLARYPDKVQYIVGSVHHVGEVPIDFDLPTFEKALAAFAPADAADEDTGRAQMEAFLCAYFDSQLEVLTRCRPEVVGHVDLCRLYKPTLQFSEYPRAYEKLKRNVAFAVGYGALFELNAAAFRKGWAAAYPGEDVVEIIRAAGGRFALSDDSHGPHAVGLNYARLFEYTRRVGITELYVLEDSDVPNAAGRYVRARAVSGSWSEHPFWERVVGQA